MPNPYPVVRSKDPLQAQSYKTQRADMPEDLWQPLYDRTSIVGSAAGVVPSSVSFFSVPKGQTANLISTQAAIISTNANTGATLSKTKTYRDTNMDSANVVPTKMFKFVGISIAFVHNIKGAIANAAEREMILTGGYFQFRIVDKDLLFLPLIALPELNPALSQAGGGGAATGTLGSSFTAVGSGGGPGIPMYKLPVPITLNPYENFSVTMSFDGSITLANALDMYVVLHGFMRRPT
jgi:hypothetical protein